MNNTTFGNDSFGYYETVAGGAGAVSEHGRPLPFTLVMVMAGSLLQYRVFSFIQETLFLANFVKETAFAEIECDCLGSGAPREWLTEPFAKIEYKFLSQLPFHEVLVPRRRECGSCGPRMYCRQSEV